MTAAEIVTESLKTEIFLTPKELSQRWRGEVSVKTLAQWRSRGFGPAFVKLGGSVLYSAADILMWEASRIKGGSKETTK